MTREEKIAHYKSLGHAVQTGIAWRIAIENPQVPDINADPNLRAHKHLRTGIDTSKSDHGALVQLLINKGLITDEEYVDAMVAGMEREKALYEQELTDHFGRKITLG
jgi:hypothetical protein